ncbi:MAG: tetratricopeptide repeat protein [Elusimicrobia bacterium]|nr:tetratricopeptide repeat protein [Elusimicrobiota bacterium]
MNNTEQTRNKTRNRHGTRTWIFIFNFSFLIFNCFFAGCGFDYYFNKGVSAKDPQKKIKYFSKAIEMWEYTKGDKNKSNVYINRGAAYSTIKDYENAVNDFTKSLTYAADSSAYYNRAVVRTYQKKYNEAINDLTAAIKINPLLENAYLLRCELYKKTKKKELAKKDFLIASKISKSAAPYFEGLKYFNNEMYPEAIEFFTKSINLNPVNAEVLNMRGLAFLRIGKSGDALTDFNKAIETDKKFIDVYNNRATIYAGCGKYDLAMADFNKIIELNPDAPEPYYNIGLINQTKNDYTGSIKYFTQAMVRSDKNPNNKVYFARGYSFYAMEKYDEALKDFSAALKLNPQDKEADLYRKNALRKKKERQGQREILELRNLKGATESHRNNTERNKK